MPGKFSNIEKVEILRAPENFTVIKKQRLKHDLKVDISNNLHPKNNTVEA